ncbi:uncharacterized protein LOC132309136 [Cornus florida]|uniref:uncharacterized protein LOC132309136 n=1 Tax=Cornus florida TaxID=4283 RepID=UPI0028A03C63|nr:uncharacterized protein LOC132309136 [Cornus florida]
MTLFPMAYSSSSANRSSSGHNKKRMYCYYGLKTLIKTSYTNRNPGRKFYGCPNYPSPTCDFHMWEDEEVSDYYKHFIYDLISEVRQHRKVRSAIKNSSFGVDDRVVELQNMVLAM